MLSELKENKSYYDILEVSADASLEEIKEGYTRAKSAYSEDSLALYSIMSPDERAQMLSLIDEAFHVISSKEKRHQYDLENGITSHQETFTISTSQEESPRYKDEKAQEQTKKTNLSTTNITKIVASNKYQLDFDKNDEFEQTIAKIDEYSGDFLRQIREYKNVSIERMSEMTRISKSNIKLIEQESTQTLPANVYVRGFVYQYAKCLKLNPDLVASSYLHRLNKLKTKPMK